MTRKKQACIILISAIVLLIVVFAALAWRALTSYATVLKINWGFSLPARAVCTEIYSADTGASFTGDGLRYHVFSYRYEDPIDSMFAWSPLQLETIFFASYQEAAETWLSDLAVPSEYYPDYSQCVYWYSSQSDTSEIIIFWDNGQDKLYILESFL